MPDETQIIATIGPASESPDILERVLMEGMALARINFAWASSEEGIERIRRVRDVAARLGRTVPAIADLPGPRVQHAGSPGYDAAASASITPHDEDVMRACVEGGIEYVALSFIGSGEDVGRYRSYLRTLSGAQRLIAKIERKAALEHLDEIISASDAIMIARGDLGSEVPLEQIPFIEQDIIARTRSAGKPVIVATQMLLSMTHSREPTRAEVTDVEEAVAQGADAVMLSEETASGEYPAEAVAMMRRIIEETLRHRTTPMPRHSL